MFPVLISGWQTRTLQQIPIYGMSCRIASSAEVLNAKDNIRYTYAAEMWVTRQCRCKRGVRSTVDAASPD